MPEPAPVIRRIRKELKQLWMDPPAFCRPGASPVTDLFHWEVIIDGPHGSPYAGGTFPVDVAYPKDYPFKPIKLTFKTKTYASLHCRCTIPTSARRGRWRWTSSGGGGGLLSR
ncbi:ubiquitin-conjugating enzyme E2 11-like isoform X2 [Triticum aestivum]|uniref:ubiquitin-conjugating enzyme E2 11-like isoform X2 n=1 Tax=Triticum aestivum TaxID=4565 RepID=UPI001D02A33A|nr:ubiquitin-conjugating enzyme E2 11-like isoform X2 [Triticum aestivum]